MTDNQFKSQVNSKKPPPPAHGVDIIGIVLTAEQPLPKTSQYPPPANLRVIPIEDAVVQFIFEQPKGRPGQPAPAKRDPLPNTSEQIHAFQKGLKFKWKKNDPISTIHLGGIYKMTGVVMECWDRDEETKLEDGTVTVERKVSYSYMINRMFPVVGDSLAAILSRTPFEKLRINPEVDFYNPFSKVPFSTSWEDSRALIVDVKPFATLPGSLKVEWFPDQPNNTLYARFPAVDTLEFLNTVEKTVSPVIQGTGKANFQLYACQKENDEVTPVSIVTRLYDDTALAVQMPKWDLTGPFMIPHLAGQMIGTTSRQESQSAYMPDSEYFSKGGFIYAYLKLIPDFRAMLTSACEPTPYRCGYKLKASLAVKFLENFKDDFSSFHVSPWSNGINILAYQGVRADCLDDDTFDFFLVSNYDWTNTRNVEAVMKMTSDDELFAEFGRKGQIVAVFACLKNPGEVALRVALTEATQKRARVVEEEEDVEDEDDEERSQI